MAGVSGTDERRVSGRQEGWARLAARSMDGGVVGGSREALAGKGDGLRLRAADGGGRVRRTPSTAREIAGVCWRNVELQFVAYKAPAIPITLARISSSRNQAMGAGGSSSLEAPVSDAS